MSNRNTVYAFLIFSIISTIPCNSQYFEYRGSTLWTGINDASVLGNYAYCAYDAGLAILDITDIGEPELISKLLFAGLRHTEPYQNYILAIGYGIDMTIINVANPFDPEIASVCETGGSCSDVCVRDTLAYVATSGYGLYIVNIADPLNPITIGQLENIGLNRTIAISGDYVYLGSGWDIIDVINISNPTLPAEIAAFQIPSNPREIEISGSTAILANYGSGLLAIDISIPTYLRILDRYDPLNVISDVGLYGNCAYSIIHSNGIEAYNFSNPSNMFYAGSYNTIDWPEDITISGDKAFLAGRNSLEIVNIADPSEMYLEGIYANPNPIYSILKTGDYLIACDGLKIWIVDVSEPQNPEPVSELTPVYNSELMGIYQNYVYLVGDGDFLSIVDISDPNSPMLINDIQFPYEFHCMQILGHYGYLGADDGVHILDLSDPLNPMEINSVQTDGVSELETDGDLLIGCGMIMTVMSIENLIEPLPIGTYNLNGRFIRGMEMQGDYVYMALLEEQVNRPGIFFIVDIENPAEPFFAGMTATDDFIEDVEVDGNLAILCNDYGGLMLANIIDPFNPEIIDTFATFGYPRNAIIEDSLVYLADGATVSVLRYNPPCLYITGDLNNSHNFNGLDPIFGVNYFKGGMIPQYNCQCGDHSDFFVAGDVNNSCSFNGLDITYMVRHLKGGPPMEPCEDCLSIHP